MENKYKSHIYPTKGESVIWLTKSGNYASFFIEGGRKDKVHPALGDNQEVCITSDEDINPKDWVVCDYGKDVDPTERYLIAQVESAAEPDMSVTAWNLVGEDTPWDGYAVRKIVAASDPNIKIECDGCKRSKNLDTIYTCSCEKYPSIPRKGIEKIIQGLNEKKTNVILEEEDIITGQCNCRCHREGVVMKHIKACCHPKAESSIKIKEGEINIIHINR